jgi:hypothetical protein
MIISRTLHTKKEATSSPLFFIKSKLTKEKNKVIQPTEANQQIYKIFKLDAMRRVPTL